jgi:hemolysin activation/secretion protein
MRYSSKHDDDPLQTLKRLLGALLVTFPPLTAQAADPVVPGAGVILQQIAPVIPPTPSPAETGLSIEPESGARLPPSAPFTVKSIRISGNTLFDTATLHALVADAEGKNLTLSQLGQAVANITDYYRSHGYPLAKAIIPVQSIQDGVVLVEVIEARYGEIRLDNRSRVNDGLLQDTLSPLQSGQAIGQEELEHALLLLSDIPGVGINATLRPGEHTGTSDLLINSTAGPAVSGNVTLDNYGNRFTGKERIGGTLNFINPLHHGDFLSISGLSSGNGINYGRIAYESLLNGQGTRIGGSYSMLRYSLGDSLASLNAHGAAQQESLWAKHPLVRSRNVNLYGQIQYERLQLRDHIDLSASQTDRHLENWTLSLAGDVRDAFLSGGINAWSLGWTAGRVGFDNAEAQSADAASARTQGRFSKWSASLSRLQNLSPKNTLYLALSGQWANANLDAAEKMIAGGPYTVRAYDVGAVSGDTGYLATIELRHDLGSAWNGQWQALVFIDSAHVTINKNAWTTEANDARLSGAGVGLNWTGSNQWSARTYAATRIGPVPALAAGVASSRVWLEISKRF